MKDQLANLLNIGFLSEKDKIALVRLLSDPDPDIFSAIRQVLLNCGIEVRSCLRSGLDSDDRLVRQRSWKLITLLDRKTANADFISFCKRGGENLNLEKGVWLLIKTTFPHINQESYQKVLDGYAERVRKDCNPKQSFPSTLMAINAARSGWRKFRLVAATSTASAAVMGSAFAWPISSAPSTNFF